MASTFFKWLIPGVVTVAGGTALALMQTGAPLATDLETRIGTSLATGNFGWTSLRIDGRDAILGGTATDQQMIDDAVTRVAAVHGVRAVNSEIVLAEFVSPFPFSASVAGEAMTLTGGYPNEAVHAALMAEAAGATDTTRLLSGGPDATSFESAAKFGLAALKQMDQGEIELADLSLSISGRARSAEAFGFLDSLRQQVPAEFRLAALTIVPPLASPYVWTATWDGTSLALSGNIPGPELEEELRAVAPANVPVSTSLVLASGEPATFAANALELLKTLLTLEQGEAAINGETITLTGAPASAEIATAATTALTALGGAATLEPARIADFALAIEKSGAALTFTGFVPDAATRDRLTALPGAVTGDLQLGRGAPDRFASGIDFALEALGQLSEGRADLKGTRLSIGGRASTVAAFRAAQALAAEGAPQGLTLAAAEFSPPVAVPFTFAAVKAANGATTLTGYVPDEATRAALAANIAELAADRTDPADGAPDNFAFLAGKGLEILALLDSGSLTYDGKNWSIEGVASTPQKGFAADAAYSVAGLRTMGWTYVVRLPEQQAAAALPTISPYVWRAQKPADGSVSFTGFAPSDGFKRYLLVRAASASDRTVLGAGAPADFGTSAAAGLDALLALDEGSLGLNGNRWTLTGAVADAGSRDAIQTALSARTNAANWQVTIQARDSAPVVTPYLWSATRAPDGAVELSGYVPNDALQSFAAVRAGTVLRDSTAIASGEPAGFADDLLAGLEALNLLQSGRAMFDGSRWILTGEVASQTDGEAVVAALLKGSRNGALWTSAISGYTPPAPIVEPAPSSEPASSEPPPAEPVASSEEPTVEPSLESSSEPASSEAAPIEPASEEPVAAVSAEPSAEPVAEPAAEDRGLTVVDQLPARFAFEAKKEGGQPIALLGSVPADATAAYFGVIAGNVPADALRVEANLPDDFIASGTAGLNALTQLNEGRLGFDGDRWWLRGLAEQPETLDAVRALVASLPKGADWSVFVDQMPPLEICRDHVAALERLNAITFQSGSATLTETSLPILDKLAVDLAICPSASVHVEGHTDADGAEDLNLALSVSRAEAVIEALIERGVSIERLYAEGYGESQPIASNDTREGKAQNRRIAFSISEE
ncbi:MAG: BON domain-containing protein [Hyphomicrobiales bacterium]|nr:MAG: BON domain-containing protein [Hyphomicrobiales bacterium]